MSNHDASHFRKMRNTREVIYGVDIAQYHVGPNRNQIGRRKWAWARLECASGALVQLQTMDPMITTGLNLGDLMTALEGDIKNEAAVSLGFEAPMWIPAPVELPEAGRLFRARCTQEAGREWYLQSGAAATVKALTFAKIIFTRLRAQFPNLHLSTSPAVPPKDTLTLFEGFVTGEVYKPDPPEGIDRGDRWDALCTALAYAKMVVGAELPPGYDADTLLPQAAGNPESYSIWMFAALAAGFDGRALADTCTVVGLRAV